MSNNSAGKRGRTRLGALVALVFAVPVFAVAPLQAQADDEATNPTPVVEDGDDKVAGSEISDSTLAELASDPSSVPATANTSVEVHGDDLDAVRAAVAAVGGDAYGEVPGFFVEARIPVAQLEALNSSPAVSRLNQVTRINSDDLDDTFANNPALDSILSDSVLVQQWHDAGHQGVGQKIGILDVFGTSELQQAVANNRIPSPAGSFCRRNGRNCSITASNGGAHGVAVAEIIHQVAPQAELYFASVVTVADLSAAIEWFGQQGVTVINRSETSELDGPGDGTGPTASLVDRAVELNMVWVSASGNAAGDSSIDGQNWIGQFNDPDGNGFHNFRNGAERMPFSCGFLLGMRWDDWSSGTIPTDYDIWIYDSPVSRVTEARGEDEQSNANHVPLEHITPRCSGANDIDYIAIRRFADVAPDGNDEIQILGNQTLMSEWVNAHSATGPGNDSRNPGAVIVGATERATSNQLAEYSSIGPTFDGRPGIDILAPSCLPIPEFFSFCFSGTSASAPVIAGLVGVLRGAGLAPSASEIEPVIAQIATDGGAPGRDPEYGFGYLSLPSPAAMGVRSTVPECNGVRATIVGTNGNDVLTGTNGVDVIFAGRGNDRIRALEGDDIICAGFGDDNIDAGPGNDTVYAGPGADAVFGRTGDDAVNGGHGHDNIEGNAGNDQLLGFTGRDYVKGGLGEDTVRGGAGNDRVVGGPGEDFVFGGNGLDYCRDAVEHNVSCRLS